MSRRNKLQKFAEVSASHNVYENFNREDKALDWCGQQVFMAGRWKEVHFKNANPITLELACGKGEYTVGLAQHFPQRNFIGVDIKGARIWKGARQAAQLDLPNAAFLRTRIEMLRSFFEQGEISEIWIVFPDPFPRESKANRRLTSPPFLDLYQYLLQPGGLVHLKTDDQRLYAYTLEVIAKEPKYVLHSHSDDLYTQAESSVETDIRTFYEIQHLAAGKKIKYVRFALTSESLHV